MIAGIQFKVCGLTSIADAEAAERCGADYLGFILYPKSPRAVSLAQFRAMTSRLPQRPTVAVSVEPTAAELTEMREAEFDYYQIHYGPETAATRVKEWSRIIGAERLWLAPKLAPNTTVSTAARSAAKFILVDTFHAAGFGGSGQTGDWAGFAGLQAAHPENQWILAGGLNAENIGDALRQSGARFVDVNSGVESAPGLKDEAKLKRFAARLHEAATTK